jgi:hypothetical protein
MKKRSYNMGLLQEVLQTLLEEKPQNNAVSDCAGLSPAFGTIDFKSFPEMGSFLFFPTIAISPYFLLVQQKSKKHRLVL